MKLYPFYILVFILLTSCGGSKRIASVNNEDLKTKEIITSHLAASPEFKTLAARVQVVYEDEEKLQSITVSLRMEKDKFIWVKASLLGITLAKVLITPEKVQYYETIGSTYFDGGFALLSEWLGTELDFQKAQNLLLGQSIFALNPSGYSAGLFQNQYRIMPKTQPLNFIHSIFLNPENFKVISESLSQPNDDRLMSVRYGNHQKVGNGFYPSEIIIDTSEKGAKTRIEMNYRKIDLNVPVSFPFEIPQGYEEIQLN